MRGCVSQRFQSPPSLPTSLRVTTAARVLQLMGTTRDGGAGRAEEKARLSLIRNGYYAQRAEAKAAREAMAAARISASQAKRGSRIPGQGRTYRCKICRQPVVGAAWYCPACAERHKAIVREERYATCGGCGLPYRIDSGESYCSDCRRGRKRAATAASRALAAQLAAPSHRAPPPPAPTRTMICRACGASQQVSRHSMMTLCRPCRSRVNSANGAGVRAQVALGCEMKRLMAQEATGV